MDMPTAVEDRVNEFVSAARDALGDQLVSAVLFGSAAEGKLRATSDVNIILVLARFLVEEGAKRIRAFSASGARPAGAVA